MITVDMAEEKRCWLWFLRMISEIVDSDGGKFLDEAIKRRHSEGDIPRATSPSPVDWLPGYGVCKAEICTPGVKSEGVELRDNNLTVLTVSEKSVIKPPG